MKMGSSGYRNRCEVACGHTTCILEAKDAVLGGILGAPGGVSGAILEDLGIPNGSGKAIFRIRSGKVQHSKILCFPVCFS